MAKTRSEPRKLSTPTPFEQARDELFSHILRCGVLEATPEHQKEWFDDTMLYLAERYDALDEQQLAELRVLGERYCRPVVGRSAPVGADAQRALVVAARRGEAETSLATRTPRHAQLRTPEGSVREDHGGPRTDLRGTHRLGARRHRHAYGEPGRGDHGPSEARRRS